MKFLIDGPKNSKRVFVLAHGAGAGMESDWMTQMAELLAERKVKVIRFNFPYMAEMVRTGKKRPPNTAKQLKEAWKQVIEEQGPAKSIAIGGKSMGGRIASLVADECGVKAFIGLGFPFHAPGKEPGDRIEHLEKMKTRSLILQGVRDSMGKKEEVVNYKLSKQVKVKWVEDGEHSFKPRKASGSTLEDNLKFAAEEIDKFLKV